MKGQPFYDTVKKCGKIICFNKQTVDFWVKWIPLASDMIGIVNCNVWTRQEYENNNVVYSCLIPKSSVIDVDVGDIIKACLNLYDIKNMEGVVKCHTSHTIRDNQHICILEVTESLAAIFEAHSRILSGPTGQLTFQLRSGDNSETKEDPMVTEESTPSVAPPNINVPRERLISDVGSVCGSSVSKDLTDLLCSSPTKNIPSPARSETDSVDLTLGNTFKKLGHNPILSDDSKVSTPVPSQNQKE